MAVPRNRLSNSRKNKRRAHHAKKSKQLIQCSNCGKPKLPHLMCEACGYYRQRQIIQIQED